MSAADQAAAPPADTETDADTVIAVRGLRNAFGAQVVHENLDLAVRRGEIAAARAAYARALRLNPRDAQLRELAVDPSRAVP
jgi:hypothetical protein